MNDDKLKDMWKSSENTLETPGYQSSRIENFISGRSDSVAEKVRKMLQLDIGLKTFVAFVFTVDAVIYVNTQPVFLLCLAGIALLVPLILFELNIKKQFAAVSDSGQNTTERLSEILVFLRSRFLTALLSIASTDIFIFISGTLVYFYLIYGKVRPLDTQDIFVFSVLILIGIVVNFVQNKSQVKYSIKHLELCLTDLSESTLIIVSENIETRQKQDRTTKFLISLVLVFAFVLLVLLFNGVFR
jgi:hypothetical protein